MLNYQRVWKIKNVPNHQPVTGAFYVGLLDGLLVAGMILTSEPVDHSRKFPAFSTSKLSTHLNYPEHIRIL